MDLENLKKFKINKKAKRLGRGESSGKGKTSGKGYKGQKVRGKVRIGFEGGQLPLIKRLPFRRGVGNALAKESLTLTLDQLSIFSSGETVDRDSLVKKGLLAKTANPKKIKIVAKGEIGKALNIKVAATKKAEVAILAAKGKISEKEKKEDNA